MGTDALDPEAEDGACEHDFCPTLNGLGPHNYQPVLDPFGGTGLWMYCNQCGDTFNVDGTASTPLGGGAHGSLSAPTSHPGSLGPLSSPKPSGPTPFP